VFRPLVVAARAPSGSTDAAAAPLYLNLLGGFRLQIADRPVVLPTHARRVLAYLSVCTDNGTGCARATIGDRLWPEADVNRARASLRTALWRIGRADRRLVLADEDVLRLGGALRVDLHATLGQATRLTRGDAPLRADDCAIAPLSMDLLPGWDEDWLLLERERVRQLQLHALDALSHRLRAVGRYSEAVDCALAAIALEPLRESARAALVAAHLAEGNVAAAHHQLDGYARLLWTELHLRPSPSITVLFTGEMRNPRGGG
jgi:DNA-binding SARP family transcriptional activator